MELAPPQRPASHRTERLPNSAFVALLPPRIETNQKPCDNISNLCGGVAIMAACAGTGKTVIAAEDAKRAITQGKKVGFFCYNSTFVGSLGAFSCFKSTFVGLPEAFSCFKSTFASCPERFWASKGFLRLARRVFGFQKNFCGSLDTFLCFKSTFVGSPSAFSGFERAFALCHRGIRRFD